ncbi:MAG TPA: OstA-like protein [Edaphocola sp.]|nr:OstA-like protein [Edaphocola sp.]
MVFFKKVGAAFQPLATTAKTAAAFLCLFMLWSMAASAQATKPGNLPDTGKALIHVLNNDYGEFIQADGRQVQKLMNNVKLRYGSDTMYCDSAFFYVNTNSVEAFGDVAVYQADGTRAFAEYMRYTSQNRQVYMRSQNSDVELDDGKGNTLWSKEIHYQLGTKTGFYNRGGTLQSGQTIVTSDAGTYNLRTKQARFRRNVVVSDPQYAVQSNDLGYNTQSKIVTFYDTATVTNQKSILKTRSGYYNTLDSTAHFTSRAAIWNGNQFIEADTLDYDHAAGLAIAKGSVIAMDTAQGLTLFSGQARFNERSGTLLAYRQPLLRTIHNQDSLFLKADTFYSAPVADSVLIRYKREKANKSLQQTASELQQMAAATDTDSTAIAHNEGPNADITTSIPHKPTDTLAAATQEAAIKDAIGQPEKSPDHLTGNDTTLLPLSHQEHFDSLQAGYQNQPEREDGSKPRYFTGYYHVQLFSDSLQGRCDSIYYNQADSLLRMYREPYLWPNNSQVSGKMIYLKLDSNRLRELIVPEEGILINRSGPAQADMYNQIQGDVIHGFFENNRLRRLTASPHAESIYYVTNDDNEYVGCSKAGSREIDILFDSTGNKVSKIYYRQNVSQDMTPMKDVQPQAMRLSRFKWQEALRPKNLATFLNGVSRPRKPEWQ